MNKQTYDKLQLLLDQAELDLKISHPNPSPSELPRSAGLIVNKNTTFDEFSPEKLALVHSMLHMFYHNKSGKGLNPKTIEQLHKQIVEKIDSHKKFDKLDETL